MAVICTRNMCKLLFLALLQIVSALSSRCLSPLEFGYASAINGVQRYEVLLKTHEAAIKMGVGVTYAGISQIDLDIPKSSKPIPLGDYTDFAGAVISVTNNVNNHYLFEIDNETERIVLTKKQFTKEGFSHVRRLKKGLHILIVEDRSPWIRQRRGYQYGVNRKDIILIEDGVAKNQPIQPYSNAFSKPQFQIADVSSSERIIKGLTLNRMKNSKCMTYLCRASNINNIRFQDITVNTPAESNLTGDRVFNIQNCTNVFFDNVVINGTYSSKDKFGYGICLDNVWNSHFSRLKTSSEWGIFGNNNINYSVLEDSDINRFDIHCYGRDVYAINTTFRNLYNQFSSFYGTLSYRSCAFIDFVPVLFESSYSSYTFFNLEMRDCFLKVDKSRPYLIRAGNPSLLDDNARVELRNASWPNITLENLSIELPKGQKDWTLFYVNGNNHNSIDGIDSIVIKGLEIRGTGKKDVIFFSNRKIKTKNSIKVSISESSFDHVQF